MKTTELYKLFLKYPVISTDTRNILPGSMFFALKGANFDGNDFAGKALSLGAKIAVVDNPSVANNKNIILVENVLEALQKLAAHHRKHLGLNVIAITGTNGKTTTKELVAAILAKKFTICFTKGNLNNHIGVPLTLLRMTRETEIGIIEMGANHPGEIEELCNIADPDYGLITNIGKAHLEGFGSFEGVKKTKSELYRHLRSKQGKVFINTNNKILVSLIDKSVSQIKYGTSENIFLKGEPVNQTPFLNIRAWFPKGLLYFNSKLIGAYNFENLLAAACIGKYFEVDPLKIQDAIKNYYPANNRSQLIEKGDNTIIMDAYNANPTSMEASINNFISIGNERKYMILGDMLELGADSLKEHQKIIDMILKHSVTQVYVVGKNFSMTTLKNPIMAFENSSMLIKHLHKNPIKKSLLLIKGSRGIQLEKVLSVLN